MHGDNAMTLRTKVLLPPLLTGLILMAAFEWWGYRQAAGVQRLHEQSAAGLSSPGRRVISHTSTGYRVLGGLGIAGAVALAWNRISWRLIAADIRGLRRQVNDIALGTWVRPRPELRTDEIGSVAMALDDLGSKLQATTMQFAAASQLAATALVGQRLLRQVSTTEDHIRSIADILAEARNS
jgi:HAMP domain-containing protein